MTLPRAKMIGSTIRRELAGIFLEESHNPLFKELVITKVEISNDLRTAYIYYTNYIHGKTNSEIIEKQLKRATPFFIRQLRERIYMKYYPELRFKYDDTIDNANRIENILKEIKKE